MNRENQMTIITPVYNEVESLDRLADVLKEYLAQAAVKSEVLFVDDGSTDGSLEKIKQICEDPNFTYISFKENRGLSSAIKRGSITVKHLCLPISMLTFRPHLLILTSFLNTLKDMMQ